MGGKSSARGAYETIKIKSSNMVNTHKYGSYCFIERIESYNRKPTVISIIVCQYDCSTEYCHYDCVSFFCAEFN